MIPKDLYEKLEFDRILQLVEAECLGDPGRQAVCNLPLMTEPRAIAIELDAVYECKRGMLHNDPLPLSTYEDLAEEVRLLGIEDYVLPDESWQRIRQMLLITQGLFRYFNPERWKLYPTLAENLRTVTFDPALIQAIDAVFDENGEIRPDASPTLARLRKAVLNRQRELDKVFRQLIAEYRAKGWLSDNVESVRNNRRVLSVPVEHKRKIRGIIHDESATGRTAFIEPEAAIDINNDIFDLQQEERREIWRILKELSNTMRPYREHLQQYQALVTRFDHIHARARLAIQLDAVRPAIFEGDRRNHAHLGIVQGRHPLLLLKNRKLGREVVPFDLTLHPPNRIVVLSGPNAGGKSILMKSVGLLQLMFQSGMLIPVGEGTQMGIFKKIFADIGDQQSLEDDLSTYSSRLENMKAFLENADDQTLVLIDEFGSGTDPKIGGAIAEAILKELNEKKVFGVITTHYTNLKLFAFKTRGIVNGSMLFDKEHLSPTYQFKIGRPGSSYAFEIAQKTGLSPRILGYARKRAGKNETAVDELLVDLQREKKEVEEKLAQLLEKEKNLERLIKSYEELHRNLEYQRRKFKLEAKQQALQEAARENRELDRLVREIREAQNLERAKALAREVKQQRTELEQAVAELQQAVEEIAQPPASRTAKKGPIAVGDYVRMRAGGAVGRVESIDRKKAIVQMGQLRMTVPLADLEHAREPLDVKSSVSIQTDIVKDNAAFDPKIDLRGMKAEDAMRTLEEFLDRAFLSSATTLQIIHGKGTGALRNLVRQLLSQYDSIRQFYHPPAEDGGDGVTIVEL
ncbi:MAG: endonuclease MutS2 [Saprospiraceae bacterium]|nr:MAG: endonuclease MutS2 [Saprospiraceae bacterium]